MASAERLLRLARDKRLAGQAAFWWGFAEGLLFFIVPDVYISFATLFSLPMGLLAWVWSIAGSVLAVGAIYGVAVVAGADYLGFLAVIPGISTALVDRVVTQVSSDGLPWTLLLVFGGVPLKLYAASGFAAGLSLGGVMLWTIFARLVRIAPTFIVVAVIRRALGRHIDTHHVAWSITLVLFWVVFYAFYFSAMTRG